VVGAVKIPSSNELFFRSKDKKDILIPFKNKKNPAERLILVSGKTDLTSKDFTVLLDYKDRYSPRILGSVTYSLMEFLKGNAKAVLLNNTEKWDILGSFFILQGLGAFIYAKNGERWTPKENNKKDFVISWDKNFIEFYLNLIKK
jgi:fructose-1,6-bisphosphatase/inositol monophosphatase family enzyme